MAGDEATVRVKKYLFERGVVVSTELRFIRRGDLFWYERNGVAERLPHIHSLSDIRVKSPYLVATGNPVWERERSGVRYFIGIKFREATTLELERANLPFVKE